MGLAYGAASEPGTGGFAKRIGVIVGPDGNVVEYQAKVDAGGYPAHALTRIS
jgi:hypothetical protein